MVPPVSHSINPERLVSLKAKSADDIAARSLSLNLCGEILRGIQSAEAPMPDCMVHRAYPDKRCGICLGQLSRPLAELQGEFYSVKKKLSDGALPDRRLRALSQRSKKLFCLMVTKLGEDWRNTVTAQRILSTPFSCGKERRIMRKGVIWRVRSERMDLLHERIKTEQMNLEKSLTEREDKSAPVERVSKAQT